MFSLGFSEILVILIVTIVFVGPDHLPGIAQKLGRIFWQVKHAAEEFKKEVAIPSLGLDTDEFKKELKSLTSLKTDMTSEVKNIILETKTLEIDQKQEPTVKIKTEEN